MSTKYTTWRSVSNLFVCYSCFTAIFYSIMAYHDGSTIFTNAMTDVNAGNDVQDPDCTIMDSNSCVKLCPRFKIKLKRAQVNEVSGSEDEVVTSTELPGEIPIPNQDLAYHGMIIKSEPDDRPTNSCQVDLSGSCPDQIKLEDIDPNLIPQPLQSPTTSTSKQPKKNKICLVCGDRAIGCNFGVISCESCKAFFRRMAFRTIRGRCKGDCTVDVESRVYCKSCRLKKCFIVGMKQDMILNENERTKRHKRIKGSESEEGLTPVASSSSSPSSSWKMEDFKFRTNECSSANSSPAAVVLWSDEDAKNLEKVNVAFQPMYDPGHSDEDLVEHPSTMDIVNMADISVRRLIKVAKGLEIFTTLTVTDQIELLKHCAIEMLILLSAPSYNPQSNSWVPMQQPNKEVHADKVGMEGNQQMKDMMEGYMKYSCSVSQMIEGDKNILHLLGVICLFSSDQICIEGKQAVEETQERYAMLLEKYIKKEHPSSNLFPRLIMKLSDLKYLKDQHSRLLSSVEIRAIAPLLKELFNL